MFGGRTSEQWIAQYASSHQHPVNRACHTFGIPIILVSLAVVPVFHCVSLALESQRSHSSSSAGLCNSSDTLLNAKRRNSSTTGVSFLSVCGGGWLSFADAPSPLTQGLSVETTSHRFGTH